MDVKIHAHEHFLSATQAHHLLIVQFFLSHYLKDYMHKGYQLSYGNMKTANCCFPTGITAYDHEPLFTADMLVYGGRYYLIGEGHKEFAPDKIKDEDYYVLTLFTVTG